MFQAQTSWISQYLHIGEIVILDEIRYTCLIFYELFCVDALNMFLLGCRIDGLLFGWSPKEQIEVVFEMEKVNVLAEISTVSHILRILDVI